MSRAIYLAPYMSRGVEKITTFLFYNMVATRILMRSIRSVIAKVIHHLSNHTQRMHALSTFTTQLYYPYLLPAVMRHHYENVRNSS